MVGVLARRIGAQRGVLAVALALVVATTAVVGAAAVLTTVAQDRAPGAALAQLPVDARSASISMGLHTSRTDFDVQEARDAAADVLVGLVAPVAARTTTWIESDPFAAADAGEVPGGPNLYLAALPADAVELVAGRLPAERDDAVVEAAVPDVALATAGRAVGDRFPVRALHGDREIEVEVVGAYRPHDPRHRWDFDQLYGRGFDPELGLPDAQGGGTHPMWGPFVVVESVLADGRDVPERMRVTVTPEVAGLDAADARALGDRLAAGGADVAAAMRGKAASATLQTDLDRSIAGVLGRTAATSSAMVVVVLVLLLVGGAAALLAARLVAEQRAFEVALMFSRGTSHRQQVVLAAAEALAVAVVTTALAPPLGALLVQACGVMLRRGHGVPTAAELLTAPALWAACGVCALLLSGLLLVPVLRRGAERSRGPVARPSSGSLRAVAQQSAGVVVLVVLAAVSVWQLSTRDVVVGVLDPVVVAAPALLLVACALLLARGLPLLARVTDRAAARSRRLVAPLAAWESGRRPERAALSVLLVTLAIGAATFSLVTLETWRTSQADQAALAVGAPVRLGDMPDDALAAAELAEQFAAANDLDLVPTRASTSGLTVEDESIGVRLVAIDDPAVLRGRLVPAGGLPGPAELGWSRAAAVIGTGPTRRAAGVDVPGGTTTLGLDVTLHGSARGTYTALLEVVLEDQRGVRTVRTFIDPVLGRSTLSVVDEPVHVEARLRADGAPAGPVRIVGVRVTVPPGELDHEEIAAAVQARTDTSVPVTLTLSGLAAVDGEGTATPLELTDGWAVRSQFEPVSPNLGGLHQVPGEARLVDGGLELSRLVSPVVFAHAGSGMTAAVTSGPGAEFPGTVGGDVAPVPAVITTAAARRLGVGIGDTVLLEEDVDVALVVEGIVDYVPGARGDAVLVRHDLLQQAELALTFPDRAPDEWWGAAGPGFAGVDAVAGTAPGGLRTGAGELAGLRDGPDRVGLQVALWLLAGAAIALAGAGAATSVASALHLRRLDLARLQALGVPRRTLVRSVLAEHGMLLGIGLVGGAAVGGATAALLSVHLAVGPDGRPPVPSAVLDLPWGWLAVAGAAAVGLVGLAVVVTAGTMVRRARAELLRLGADR